MMEIERPRIDTTSLSPDGRYGKFVVEPLERGFGTTLGNSCLLYTSHMPYLFGLRPAYLAQTAVCERKHLAFHGHYRKGAGLVATRCV